MQLQQVVFLHTGTKTLCKPGHKSKMQESLLECTIDWTKLYRTDGNSKIVFDFVYWILVLMKTVIPGARKIVFISPQLPEYIKRHISDLNIQREIF